MDFAYHSGAFPRKFISMSGTGAPLQAKGLIEPAEECIVIYA